MTDHVALREFIETLIARDNNYRDQQRLDDDRRIQDKFAALDKALILQATAFPTVKDFNELKNNVLSELASRSSSSNAVTTLFQVLTVISMLFSTVIGYLVFLKGV